MKFRLKSASCLLLAVGVSMPNVLAGSHDEETKSFPAKEIVKINTVSGDAVIEVGTDDKIHVTVEHWYRPDDSFEPRMKERTRSLELSERMYGSNSGGSRWTVTVPQGTIVEFSTASGDFSVVGLNAEIEVNTASGDIEIEGCDGEFDVSVASGDIIAVDCKGVFDLSTASGDVEIDRCEGEFDLSSASGNVEAKRVKLLHESEFSSASGDVDLVLKESPEHDFRVSSASGDANLDYNGNPVRGFFEFTVRDRRGRIKAPFDFDDEESFRRHGERYVRKSVTIGADSPIVAISSASGRASLRE